jgi:octaprenyl-diphosphate synthase
MIFMDIENINRLKKIEKELERWLPSNFETIAKSDWVEKIFPGIGKDMKSSSTDTLIEPLRDMLSRGGKRWRPLLMTLVCETLGGGGAALPLAPLVEFSHNASLIHDDIEDDSDERRNKPAIHKIYGTDTAINAGSFFYFLSLCCIEVYKGDNKALIYKLWAEYMRRLHLGQAMDINWHSDIKIIPDIDDYFVMCALKTGSLSRFAAELGAYLAGASTEIARYLGEAAEKLGIGFQILDDVKNLTTGVPGKRRSDDIVEGKKSYPVLLYLHKHPEKRERIFYCFYEARTNGFFFFFIQEMIELLTYSGFIKEAEEKALSLIKEVRGVFNSPQYCDFSVSEKDRALLDDLINMIS